MEPHPQRLSLGMGLEHFRQELKLLLSRTSRRDAQAIVHQDTLSPVGDPTQVIEVAQVAGGLGLGDAQSADDIADAEFSSLQQEPQDLQAGLVRQGLEKPSALMIFLYIRLIE